MFADVSKGFDLPVFRVQEAQRRKKVRATEMEGNSVTISQIVWCHMPAFLNSHNIWSMLK
jgi:hypothetical protein